MGCYNSLVTISLVPRLFAGGGKPGYEARSLYTHRAHDISPILPQEYVHESRYVL